MPLLRLTQFFEEVHHRQHPLAQIPILQLDAQLVLSRHLDVPFALDQGDDLHRVDGRGRHELDGDGLVHLADAERLSEDAQAVAVEQGLRAIGQQAEAVGTLLL